MGVGLFLLLTEVQALEHHTPLVLRDEWVIPHSQQRPLYHCIHHSGTETFYTSYLCTLNLYRESKGWFMVADLGWAAGGENKH